MPSYLYYPEEREHPIGAALGQGFYKGFTGGIERALQRKQKAADFKQQLQLAGLEPVQEGVEYEQEYDFGGDLGRYGKRKTEKLKLELQKLQAEVNELKKPKMTWNEFIGTDVNQPVNTGDWDKQFEFNADGTIKTVKLVPKKSDLPERKFKAEQEEKAEKEKKTDELILQNAREMLDNIMVAKDGIKHFGISGLFPAISAGKRKWKANVDKLLATKVLQIMTTLKQASRTGATGFGQLNKSELVLLQQSATELKKWLAEEDAMEVLNRMEGIARKLVTPINQQDVQVGDMGSGGNEDQEALDWAIANPGDPRATQILNMLRTR